jgi:hypothetical protein
MTKKHGILGGKFFFVEILIPMEKHLAKAWHV